VELVTELAPESAVTQVYTYITSILKAARWRCTSASVEHPDEHAVHDGHHGVGNRERRMTCGGERRGGAAEDEHLDREPAAARRPARLRRGERAPEERRRDRQRRREPRGLRRAPPAECRQRGQLQQKADGQRDAAAQGANVTSSPSTVARAGVVSATTRPRRITQRRTGFRRRTSIALAASKTTQTAGLPSSMP
jgi:hypothetical protein